jgi:hypothetical protein
LNLKKKNIIDFNYFIIGAQGPDPLFHYNFVPWKSSGDASKIASRIHKTKTKAFLTSLLTKAKSASKEIKGFALGFLCHYALDTTAHPYIFHKTGNYSKKNKQYRGNHLRLEKAIDNYNVAKRGHNPRFYKAKKHFPLPTLSIEFTNIFSDVMDDVYGLKDIGLLFTESYEHFRKSVHVLSYDPFGFKKIIYKLADLLIDNSTGYYSLSPRTNTKHLDFMNLQKEIWKHPVTGEESNQSFSELYDIALDKVKTLISLALDYFDNKSETIFETIKNVTYDTNLDCDENQKMKFIDSIFN